MAKHNTAEGWKSREKLYRQNEETACDAVFWRGFILVALRIVNTIPLPEIAGGPPQNLRASGRDSDSLDGVRQRKRLFLLIAVQILKA